MTSQKMSAKKPGLSLVPIAKPKLLDQLREALRSRHYSHRTEQTYCSLHPRPQPGRQGCQESRGRFVEEKRRCVIQKPYILPRSVQKTAC